MEISICFYIPGATTVEQLRVILSIPEHRVSTDPPVRRHGGGRNAQLTVDAVSGRTNTTRGGTARWLVRSFARSFVRSLARSLARLSEVVIGDRRGSGGVPIATAAVSDGAALARPVDVLRHTHARA